jgi:hypothetical protein
VTKTNPAFTWAIWGRRRAPQAKQEAESKFSSMMNFSSPPKSLWSGELKRQKNCREHIFTWALRLFANNIKTGGERARGPREECGPWHTRAFLFALMQLSLSLSHFRTAFVQIGIKLEESRVLFFLLSRAGTFPAVAFDQMYCTRDRFGCKQKQSPLGWWMRALYIFLRLSPPQLWLLLTEITSYLCVLRARVPSRV